MLRFNAKTQRRRDAKKKFFRLCVSASLRLCVKYMGAVAFPILAALPLPPPDWRIELIASAPDIQHPSVVCVAPDGRVFVAEDPMDIRAPANAAQGRVLCFHPDGRRTVFADNLYAVFGMQYLEGNLYVLHNPKFSVFTPTGRVDLIESTHPNPWALDWNDHVPANFKLAMDGYFYIAVGDKGMYGAVGRDGRRLDLHGGGIVRMRPDGTGLEIFASGVRNILDVAINEEDEIFTYDNTDEHEWMGRLTHMVEHGFYGYPFDFIPRRPYTLWMMADFGGGAATGAFVYNEDALPPEYRGNLFLADFGKRQLMRVVVARDGATYRVVSKQDFFTDPPEDFRPVGIAPGADALSIYICDWNHRDTKENVAVGRLLKLSYTGKSHAKPQPTNLIEALSHPARNVRLAAQRQLKEDVLARVTDERAVWHAIWLSSNVAKYLADERPSVRRQALRRNVSPASEVRKHLGDRDASVRFQAGTVLGKIGATDDVLPLRTLLADSDAVVRYAAFTALNHIGRAHPETWSDICAGLKHINKLIRENTTYALRETYDLKLVKQLQAIGTPEAIRLLASVHHKTPEWKGEWWAYHPFSTMPPAKTVPWDGTPIILPILRESLTNADPIVVQALAEARDSQSVPQFRKLLETSHKLDALRALLKAAAALRIDSPAVTRYASHADTEIRSAALDALIAVDRDSAASKILPLLKHSDAAVRVSAVTALGSLKNRSAFDPLLAAYKDPATREQAIVALAQTPDVKAIDAYIDGLARTNLTIRESARKALRAIKDEARPILEKRSDLASEFRLIYGSEGAAGADDYLREGLANKGERAKGQNLFAKLCVQCHAVRGQGGAVGPDLTTVGAQFSRREIAESILFPSKAVREGYQSVNIETQDGELYSGLLKAETPDQVTIVDSAAQLHRIPKNQIASRKLSELSLMPEGLHAALTHAEFSDLLAFLEGLR